MNVKYTHRTCYGRLARIIATDIVGEYSVAVAIKDDMSKTETIVLYRSDMSANPLYGRDLELVEYNLWEDVAVDTKILVRDWDGGEWYHRYFSHYHNGQVYAFESGATSWSVNNFRTVEWKQAKLAE